MDRLNERLCEAVKNGEMALASRLIEQGADVNAGVNDWLALADAAYYGHAEMCKLLISAGAKVSGATRRGSTPLHAACFPYGSKLSTEVIACLVGAGANLDALRHSDLKAPLHLLAEIDNSLRLEVTRLLIDAGAHPDLGLAEQCVTVINHNREPEVRLIGSSASSDVYRHYLTPPQTAVYWGSRDLIEFYIERDEDCILQPTANGQSIFDLAANGAAQGAVFLSVLSERSIRLALPVDGNEKALSIGRVPKPSMGML